MNIKQKRRYLKNFKKSCGMKLFVLASIGGINYMELL